MDRLLTQSAVGGAEGDANQIKLDISKRADRTPAHCITLWRIALSEIEAFRREDIVEIVRDIESRVTSCLGV